MFTLRLGAKKTSEQNWIKRLGKGEVEVLSFVKIHGSALREKWSSAMSFKHMMWRLRYQFRQAVSSQRRHSSRTQFGLSIPGKRNARKVL